MPDEPAELKTAMKKMARTDDELGKSKAVQR